MSIAKQLYQLQEIDLEIESNERALSRIARQIGESAEVVAAQTRLELASKRLEELEHQQRSTEWEIDDITSKLAAAEEKLYSGKIRNPKELTNLQQEVEGMKVRRHQLEDKALEMMEQVELVTTNVANLSKELKRLESEWRSQQQQFSSEMERLKTALSGLKHKRGLLLAKIDPQSVAFYHELKKQKATAVARVEQGTCSGCRISLPTSELQQARSGNLVQCSSCGRILFLA